MIPFTIENNFSTRSSCFLQVEKALASVAKQEVKTEAPVAVEAKPGSSLPQYKGVPQSLLEKVCLFCDS